MLNEIKQVPGGFSLENTIKLFGKLDNIPFSDEIYDYLDKAYEMCHGEGEEYYSDASYNDIIKTLDVNSLIYLFIKLKEYESQMENRDALKERIKQMVREMIAEDGMAVNSTDNCGCEYSTPKAFKKKSKIQEQIDQLIEKELLNEANYSSFRNEIKFRTKSEQLHKAIKEVKRKISEINRIVEYTSRMKQELSESEEGIKYWKATSKNVGQIQEIITQLSNKLKNLNQ